MRAAWRSEIEKLVDLVNIYRKVVNALLTRLEQSHFRKTEVYSRELLVAWLAYCIVFASIRERFGSTLPGMSVCLRYKDLEHLVLSERRLWSILHILKCFLQKHSIHGRELFSLRDPDATFDMGENFSRNHHFAVYEAECSDAEHREQRYWRAVTQKKDLVQCLRNQLAELEADALDLEAKVASLRSEMKDFCDYSHLQSQLSKTLSRLKDQRRDISRKTSD